MRFPIKKETPITGDIQFHLDNEAGYAIDFGCQIGDELYAVVSGSVEKFYTWWGGSDTLILHGDNGVFYLYAHCLDTVRTGRINEGDVIGHSGNDGNSTGPHLHFGASRDYNRLKAYSTSLDSDCLFEVLNNSNESSNGSGSLLVEFNNNYRFYDFEGNVIDTTKPGYYGRISRSAFFDSWYTVEFTFGVFYMKSEAINDEDVRDAGKRTNASMVKFSGDVDVYNNNGDKFSSIHNNWLGKVYKSEFHNDKYVIELAYGSYLIDSADVNGDLCSLA